MTSIVFSDLFIVVLGLDEALASRGSVSGSG